MGAWANQKTVLDPLVLELEIVMSHLAWVLGPKLGCSGRAASTLNLLGISLQTPILLSNSNKEVVYIRNM